MRRPAACVLAAIVSVCFLIPPSRSPARTMLLSDLRKEVTLADPQISPDGRQIALLVGRNDFEHDIVAVSIVMVDAASGTQSVLSIPKTDIASPRWSPDGSQIAFLASNQNEQMQLYAASPSGAGLRKLTGASQGVEYFAWRPDGRAIAYVTADAPPVRHGAAKFNTSFEAGDNDYLTSAPPLPSHLWLVQTNGTAAARLTRGSWSLPSGVYELTQPYLGSLIAPQHFPNQLFCWYPDGNSIAYTKAPDPYMAHADRAIMVVRDLATGGERPLTARDGLEAGCDMSPNGREIAYWYPREGKALNASSIFVTGSADRGRNGVDVTRQLDRSPWQVRWMPDSASLLILAHDGTREGMWLAGTERSLRRLDTGDLNASGASVSTSGTIAFVASGPLEPSELYLVMSAGAAPRRLSAFNGYFASLRLGAVKHVAWQYDGFSEDGVLTYPPNFIAGKKYPLVLQIHGWPQYASLEAFDTDYPGLTQLFAAHGYLAFEPNYRGSDSKGNVFESAIIGDTADGPGRDIMAGVAAVEKLGIVDQSRIAVSGWSYGGLMTVWLIGHHDWKAAMAGAAPTDLSLDYAIGNYSVLDRHFYGSRPWQSKAAHQLYVDQSPITYAWNMRTPTLIMSSIYDTTVPVAHSYELYHALRDRGVPVQLIVYPSSEHFTSDPVLGEDIFRRWVGWLDRYLR